MTNKFTQARANLILDEPFFGALALRLDAIEDPTAKTFWTDGKKIGYNPAYAEKLSLAEMQGVICHEVMHVACGHPWRRDNRDKKTWNVAADYAINPIIVDAKMKLPGEPLLDPIYLGQSVEQIYAMRAAQKAAEDKKRAEEEARKEEEKASAEKEKSDEKEEEHGQEDSESEDPQDDNAAETAEDAVESKANGNPSSEGENAAEGDPADMGCGEVRDSTGEDAEVEETEWKVAVLQAAQAAKAQGKLPAGVEQLVEKIRRTRIDWKAALRRFVQMCARQDYSWRMPDKKFVSAGLYMPALISENMPPVVIYWDTSGSRDNEAARSECASEAAAVIEECRPEKTYVVYGDAKVQRVDEFEAGEPVEFHPKGGGGTRFEPIFEWVKEQGIEPACFIGITDLYGSFPKEVPEYPVLWVLPSGGRREAPFGEIIRLEDNI